MNSTNRVLNRLVIGLIGLILLVVGAAAVLLMTLPAFRDVWVEQTGLAVGQVSTWMQQSPIGDAGISWITVGALGALVVAVILLIAFIVRQGRGSTRVAVTEPTGENGTTIVESAVAEQALAGVLGDRPEFVASHVSTYRVRRTPVLKVTVTCRRGVSPKDAAQIVEEAVVALDELLGRSIPTLVQISGGFRARVSSTTRLN